MKILGIDPGSRATGYAVLEENNRIFTPLAIGVIRTHDIDDHTRRLQTIFEEVSELVSIHKPDECAVETPVYGSDPLAMLKLGRAQAAAILAVTNSGLQIAEYYPKAVKKAITGNGNASKKQVASMLQRMMELGDVSLTNDATDALAVAWCHHMRRNSVAGQSKKTHQNNSKSGWAAFMEQNPDRVKKH
ncbi:MAG: crossover junction endodeoxyribonuclease RuvC [Balneolaceae bacterium]